MRDFRTIPTGIWWFGAGLQLLVALISAIWMEEFSYAPTAQHAGVLAAPAVVLGTLWLVIRGLHWASSVSHQVRTTVGGLLGVVLIAGAAGTVTPIHADKVMALEARHVALGTGCRAGLLVRDQSECNGPTHQIGDLIRQTPDGWFQVFGNPRNSNHLGPEVKFSELLTGRLTPEARLWAELHKMGDGTGAVPWWVSFSTALLALVPTFFIMRLAVPLLLRARQTSDWNRTGRPFQVAGAAIGLLAGWSVLTGSKPASLMLVGLGLLAPFACLYALRARHFTGASLLVALWPLVPFAAFAAWTPPATVALVGAACVTVLGIASLHAVITICALPTAPDSGAPESPVRMATSVKLPYASDSLRLLQALTFLLAALVLGFSWDQLAALNTRWYGEQDLFKLLRTSVAVAAVAGVAISGTRIAAARFTAVANPSQWRRLVLQTIWPTLITSLAPGAMLIGAGLRGLSRYSLAESCTDRTFSEPSALWTLDFSACAETAWNSRLGHVDLQLVEAARLSGDLEPSAVPGPVLLWLVGCLASSVILTLTWSLCALAPIGRPLGRPQAYRGMAIALSVGVLLGMIVAVAEEAFGIVVGRAMLVALIWGVPSAGVLFLAFQVRQARFSANSALGPVVVSAFLGCAPYANSTAQNGGDWCVDPTAVGASLILTVLLFVPLHTLYCRLRALPG